MIYKMGWSKSKSWLKFNVILLSTYDRISFMLSLACAHVINALQFNNIYKFFTPEIEWVCDKKALGSNDIDHLNNEYIVKIYCKKIILY